MRVLVANVAPEVSGQIVELRFADNQSVKKSDVLYRIDPFDFESKRDSAKAQLQAKAADLQVKRVEAQRRQALTSAAASVEEKQQYAGNSSMAEADFLDAQAQLAMAEVNLKRTEVRSPVNGYVTNLTLRVGDYATTGSTSISVVDADSFWIDGYFEETKLARICVGDPAEAQLIGFSRPITGRIASLGRGISDSDAASGTQGLPSVDAVYSWVRLAQRVPIRVDIVNVPKGVPLIGGLTATVRIRTAGETDGLGTRLSAAAEDVLTAFRLRPPRERDCSRPDNGTTSPVSTLPNDKAAPPTSATDIVPGLAPSMDAPPAAKP